MEESAHPTNGKNAKDHVDKLVAVQRNLAELHQETRELRLNARGEGFNAEALLMLAQIRTQNPHDEGEEFLNAMIKAAHDFGYPLRDIAVVQGEMVAPEPRPPLEPREIPQQPEPLRDAGIVGEKIGLLLQLTLGVVVSGLFLWILR